MATKHTEAVKCWLTESEFNDLSRLAAREDRKVSELIRVMIRKSMYGTLGADCCDSNEPNSPAQGEESRGGRA
jgi:hypothetical protein